MQAASQPPGSLTGNSSPAADSLVNMYYADQKESPLLYNGRQFYGYASSIQGHAYYLSNTWNPGFVLFDGLLYRDKELMYDIYRDELIIKHPKGIHVILFRERVQQFNLAGQFFVYIEKNSEAGIRNGFYQQLTDGKATAYVKRVKILEEKIDGLVLERKFLPADQFFILKDKIYQPVKKQKDLLKILKDKRQELSQYKSRQKIKYKENPEQFIVRMTAYYNQL